MGWPVVVVESRGAPVTEALNGFGAPVSIATNGLGAPVTPVQSGGAPIVGAAAAFAGEPAPEGFRWDFVFFDGALVTLDGEPVVSLVEVA